MELTQLLNCTFFNCNTLFCDNMAVWKFSKVMFSKNTYLLIGFIETAAPLYAESLRIIIGVFAIMKRVSLLKCISSLSMIGDLNNESEMISVFPINLFMVS